MDTSQLKRFAAKLRTQLMKGVEERLLYWGFDPKGNPIIDPPEAVEGGYFFRGNVFSDPTVPARWTSLRLAIGRHSLKDVIEQGAYTWFNRLLSIRIMEKNGYIEPVLEYPEGRNEPGILFRARQGALPEYAERQREMIEQLLAENRDAEAFNHLLVGFLKRQDLLSRVFGDLDDYTELLLPASIIGPESPVDFIVSSDAITDDDFCQVELIGWLYQFYIADRKDEVFEAFGKGKKARPEDIPAATQIFTPRWIVKYMVENTIGRLWLDVHPDSPLREGLRYLVEPDTPSHEEPLLPSQRAWDGRDLRKLTMLDPAVGSGHILVVAFDLLMEMYAVDGYTKRQAVDAILEHNLFGLDIDDRAVQLARFALLMKAAAHDRGILTRSVVPHVYAFPEAERFSDSDIRGFLDEEGMQYEAEFRAALNLMQIGKNVGSALKVELGEKTREYLIARHQELVRNQSSDLYLRGLLLRLNSFIHTALILAQKYCAVTANPPYMGNTGMNGELKQYLEKSFPISRADLMTVFMEVAIDRCKEHGYISMINIPSWMFLSTFDGLRKAICNNCTIRSLNHFGRGVFGADYGSVGFTFQNKPYRNESGVFRKLFVKSGTVDSCGQKEEWFLEKTFGRFEIQQSNFSVIPGGPFAYWASAHMLDAFKSHPPLGDFVITREGMATSDNRRFLRFWFEVSQSMIGFEIADVAHSVQSSRRWFPYNKGGAFRKWFGNNEYVVNWYNDGQEIRENIDPETKRVRSHNYNGEYAFREGFTWSSLTSGDISIRYSSPGHLFDSKGAMGFLSEENDKLPAYIAFLNSSTASALLGLMTPTVDFKVGDLIRIPFNCGLVESRSLFDSGSECIEIARAEWATRETAWEFTNNPLVGQLSFDIRSSMKKWTDMERSRFHKLQRLEELINREVSESYGLEKEVLDTVPLSRIAYLRDVIDPATLTRELPIQSNEIECSTSKQVLFLLEVPIQQLISYALGCWMGRYRLDHPGLAIAHPTPSPEQVAPYTVSMPLHATGNAGEATVAIDPDGIIPLVGLDSPFGDDVLHRVIEFLRIVWGEQTLTDNLNFINEVLSQWKCRGKAKAKQYTLEEYLVNDFWNFHKSMYSKRPIYWLFASPKRSFQVLVYMHRMDRYTVQKIRYNYLHPFLRYLNEQIATLETDEATLGRVDARRLEILRKDESECRAYDDTLKVLADQQIDIDLNDGFLVNYPKFASAMAAV